MRFRKALTSSYDSESWELVVYLDGHRYVYKNISPHHNGAFVALARKNKGRAMAYLRRLEGG